MRGRKRNTEKVEGGGTEQIEEGYPIGREGCETDREQKGEWKKTAGRRGSERDSAAASPKDEKATMGRELNFVGWEEVVVVWDGKG